MKKLGKRFLILLGIIGLGYLVFTFFIKANGYEDQGILTKAFMDNIDDSKSCETYFDQSLVEVCDTFRAGLTDMDYEIVGYKKITGTVEVEIWVDSTEETFVFTFVVYKPSGLRSIFTDKYYLIETVK